MLDLLRQNYDQDKIVLTHQIKHDRRWFQIFLKAYNGVSVYDNPPVNHTIELDACLIGLGGRWESFGYHLSIPKGFMNMTT